LIAHAVKPNFHDLIDPIWGKPLTDAVKCPLCPEKHCLSEVALKTASQISGLATCPLDRTPIHEYVPNDEIRGLAQRYLVEMIRSGLVELGDTIDDLYHIDDQTDSLRENSFKLIHTGNFKEALPLLDQLIMFFPNIRVLRYARMICNHSSGIDNLNQMKEDSEICFLYSNYPYTNEVHIMLREAESQHQKTTPIT
jgi:hypothetical protein